MLLGHGARSVFEYVEPVVPVQHERSRSSGGEREALRQICEQHFLDEYYYDAAIVLWERIRSAYTCLCYTYGAHRYLAICLGLAIKFAGPKTQTHAYCTLRHMRQYWQYLSLERLQCEELKMCRLLKWDFR